jgi:hypothetical protein
VVHAIDAVHLVEVPPGNSIAATLESTPPERPYITLLLPTGAIAKSQLAPDTCEVPPVPRRGDVGSQ